MTRWVAVSLLVFNLLVIGWMFDVARYAQGPVPKPLQQGEAIQLASEVGASGLSPTTTTSPPPETEANAVAAQSDPNAGRSGFSPTTPPETVVAAQSDPNAGRSGFSPTTTTSAPAETEATVAVAVATPPELVPAETDASIDGAEPEPEPEASPSPEPTAVATLTQTPEPTPTPTCVHVGPFERQTTAQKLKTWFTDHGGEVLERTEHNPVTAPLRTWLYLGPFPDFTTAMVENDRLSELGLKDVLAVRHKELGPVVSLGLFATESGLKTRMKQLEAHNIEPERKQSYPEGSEQYWLDIRFPPGSRFDAELFGTIGDPKLALQADCG